MSLFQKKYKNKCVLVISDMHVPYQHRDTVKFLEAVKKKYNPDRVISIGDEVDKHALSFHDSDPDLPSAGDELRLAIKALQPIYKLFPRMDIISSNHGDMVYRKAKHHGIPKAYLQSYGEVLQAPIGWKWHNDLTITLSNKTQCYFHHGLSSNILKVVKEYSLNVVHGHYHNSAGVHYASTPEKLLWGLQVGCLIDDNSLAFAYNKTTLGRPMIGVGIIENGLPRWLPMIVKNGKWTGVLP